MALHDQIDELLSWSNECRLILWNVEDGLDMRSLSAYDKAAHGGIGHVAQANREVLIELIEAMQWLFTDTRVLSIMLITIMLIMVCFIKNPS